MHKKALTPYFYITGDLRGADQSKYRQRDQFHQRGEKTAEHGEREVRFLLSGAHLVLGKYILAGRGQAVGQ